MFQTTLIEKFMFQKPPCSRSVRLHGGKPDWEGWGEGREEEHLKVKKMQKG